MAGPPAFLRRRRSCPQPDGDAALFRPGLPARQNQFRDESGSRITTSFSRAGIPVQTRAWSPPTPRLPPGPPPRPGWRTGAAGLHYADTAGCGSLLAAGQRPCGVLKIFQFGLRIFAASPGPSAPLGFPVFGFLRRFCLFNLTVPAGPGRTNRQIRRGLPRRRPYSPSRSRHRKIASASSTANVIQSPSTVHHP